MALRFGLVLVLLAIHVFSLEAGQLRGKEVPAANKTVSVAEPAVKAAPTKKVALVQMQKALRDVDGDEDGDGESDDDMMFEGDADDESSAEAQLERMHLNDMLGYSAKEAQEDERNDIENRAEDIDTQDDADAEAAIDEAVKQGSNAHSASEESEEVGLETQHDEEVARARAESEELQKEANFREESKTSHDEEEEGEEPVDADTEADKLSVDEMMGSDAEEGGAASASLLQSKAAEPILADEQLADLHLEESLSEDLSESGEDDLADDDGYESVGDEATAEAEEGIQGESEADLESDEDQIAEGDVEDVEEVEE